MGWLLIDLQWIHIPLFSKKSLVVGLKEAGYVLKAGEDLKRRGANSLIWDGAREKDILYYKDSILTLSQSTAKLYLKDQTELQLSENTLVTIEEPEATSKSEIRLRFSKGDLKARNPTNTTTIQGDEWIVNLEKGSEISLRKDKDSYEFEVISGQAQLQTEAGAQALNSSQILKLGQNKEIKTLTKNKNIQWKDKKLTRFYTLDEEKSVPLAWDGEVSQIEIQKSGEAQVQKNVSDPHSTSVVTLKLGNYKVRLQGPEGLSDAREIEIWKAPHIYLKKPLPRDRIHMGQPIEFVWTNEAGIKNYQLKFNAVSGKRAPSSPKAVSENFQTVQFDDEYDLTWKVEGYDPDGFLVPALYENPVFIREKPLQAPQLKSPQIRTPIPDQKPKDNSWLYELLKPLNRLSQILIRRVQAAEHYEITFQWESVVGANKYVLEVATTPDFRDPVLIENVKTTDYIWKKVKYKKYYWRVAAGSSRGRMGFFSEPLELKLEDIKKIETPTVVKVPPLVEKVVEDISRVKNPESTPPVIVAAEIKNTKPNASWGVAWMPSYKLADAQSTDGAHLHLAGGVLQGLHLQYQTPQWGRAIYQLSLKRSQQSWRPTPESEYAFQKSLTLVESWLKMDRAIVDENLCYGVVMHESFFPVRSTSESMSLTSVLTFGPRMSWKESPPGKNEKTVGVFALIGQKVTEFGVDGDYKYYISDPKQQNRFYIGTSGNYLFQIQNSKSGIQVNLNLLFGFDHL